MKVTFTLLVAMLWWSCKTSLASTPMPNENVQEAERIGRFSAALADAMLLIQKAAGHTTGQWSLNSTTIRSANTILLRVAAKERVPRKEKTWLESAKSYGYAFVCAQCIHDIYTNARSTDEFHSFTYTQLLVDAAARRDFDRKTKLRHAGWIRFFGIRNRNSEHNAS